MPPTLNTVQLNVEFNPANLTSPEGPVSISGPFITIPPNPTRLLLIPQGITLIVFNLIPLLPGEDAQPQFPTYPIEWFNESGSTISQPDCFDVHWYNPNQCTVVDFNSALQAQPHTFNVVVAYKNKTYGTDPTIVNQPPIGG